MRLQIQIEKTHQIYVTELRQNIGRQPYNFRHVGIDRARSIQTAKYTDGDRHALLNTHTSDKHILHLHLTRL